MLRRSFSQRLALLLAVSVVAGVLVAGMLLPFVGGAGLAARSATNDFNKLPTDLVEKPLPQVSKVLDATGQPIATFFDQDRRIVSLDQVPMQMQEAIIAVEDVRFYEHHGIDFKGMIRALLRNGSSGKVSQGGSTLTQQYVKNVLIEDAHTKKQREAAVADTLSRKVREAKLALALEHKLTKPQILENYLNIDYFGDGAYGIGTAARHYFNVNVSKLTLPESAMLAGLVQSPDAYDPVLHPVAAKGRRDDVLGQMLKYHFIDQSDYDAAIASPVKLHVQHQPNDCIASKYPYFCDYVKHVFKRTPGLGLGKLRRGGLTVTTTIDPKIQAAADDGIHGYVFHHEHSKVVAAEAVVQPGSGQVKAIAVSQDYGNDPKKGQNSIDYAVDTSMGGGQGFRMGSTFKMFVLAAALKEGIPLGTTIKAPGQITVKDYTDCAGNSLTYPNVHNDEAGGGRSYNLKTGTWFSVNTFFAQLEQRTGLCEPVKLAESMGVRALGVNIGTAAHPHIVQRKAIPQVPSFVLGSAAGFSPLDLANAYATLAAHGTYCQPVVISKIVDTSGRSYPVPKPHCHTVLQASLADTVTSILQGVLKVRGATGTSDALTARPAAAKTGTVDDYQGSAFAGYTPQLAAAAWAGVPSSPNTSLRGLSFGGRYYGGPVFGATVAGRIWQSTMNTALAGKPVEQFAGPAISYQGTRASVPDVTGLSVSDATAALTQEGFSPQVVPGFVHDLAPAGTVAHTSPGAGQAAYAGSEVRIYVSDGKPATPKGKKTKEPTPPPAHSPPPSMQPSTPPPTKKP